MQNNSFSNFYLEYLGLADSVICNGVRLCKSKYRDIPINKKYFYKVIATKYNGEKIISYSPDISETELKSLNAKINFEVIGQGNIPDDFKLPQYELSYMNRMFLDSQSDISMDKNSDSNNNHSIEYIYSDEYRKYIALIDGELIGYCKVSDVIAGYGNLVVWVEESRRRLGIAERLVRLMIKKCYEEEIEPMYVVKTDNHASIALAQKLGFQVKQRELVVSYTRGIN